MLLMPVAVLVLLILAAIAVDAAVLFLGQRRVADLAASVAQDAVAYVAPASFYAGDLALDRPDGEVFRPGQRADALTARLPQDDALLGPDCTVTTDQGAEGPVATARCTAQVRFIFAPAVPGSQRMSRVEASETAVGLSGG